MASGSRKLPLLYVLASVTVVLAGLYWARVVLLPVALAVLLTFLLNPVITMLHRWGVPRVLAVALVVVLAFIGLGGVEGDLIPNGSPREICDRSGER
jgi:predicted PurR-regulated permease PerM